MTYVVIACHFKDKREVCATTVARLRETLRIADKKADQVVVTGDMPFQPRGETLGQLMRSRLVMCGFPESSTFLLRGGLGAFSEARIACETLKEYGAISVISSDWYLFYARPIWKIRARENKIGISFVPISGTGGWRTRLLYTGFGVLVHLALVLGLEGSLEKLAEAKQASRREGFKFDGCS